MGEFLFGSFSFLLLLRFLLSDLVCMETLPIIDKSALSFFISLRLPALLGLQHSEMLCLGYLKIVTSLKIMIV